MHSKLPEGLPEAFRGWIAFFSRRQRGLRAMSNTDSIRDWRLAWLAGIVVASACGGAHGQGKTDALPTALATSYIPPDASFALLVRPAELAVPELMQPVVDAFDELLKPARLGISVADIDEFKFVVIGRPDVMQGPPDIYLVIRARQAVDWKIVFEVGAQAKVEEINGRKLYHVRGDREALWLPDERSVVFGMGGAVRRTMENPDPNDREPWTERWQHAAKSPVAAFLQASVLQAFEEGMLGSGDQHQKALAALTGDAQFGVLQGNVTPKGLEVAATMLTRSKEGSVRIAPVVSRVLTHLATMIGSEVPVGQQDAEKLREQLAALLRSTQIVTEGQTVTVKAVVTPEMLEVFSATLRQMADPQP
jgi:hypothetical protein